MIKNKKLIIALMLIFTIVLCTACGEKDYVGTWSITKATMNGKDVDVKTLGKFSFEIKNDGSVLVSRADGNKTQDRWEVTDDGVKIISSTTNQEDAFKSEGEKLIASQNGVELTFERK